MYESHYGLNSKPFQLTPDPEFFFASKWHKRAMSYLQYGLSQAEGFIVITGDIGTGKTTLANSLLNDLQNDIFAAQIVTPKLSPDELVKMVAAKFELDVANKTKADLLKDLESFLSALHQQGRRALLLVDEAQNLPLETIEELRMLSNFQAKGKPLLQSFLLGQEELQPILRAPNMEQFRQRIVASCHLAPLTDEECRAYIEYRMHHAGWNGANLFSNEAYEKIYQFTHGVPRKINTLMDRILLYGFLEELERLDEEAVENVVKEVADEMFIPEPEEEIKKHEVTELTPEGHEVKDIEYYKNMLNELVDALDNAISHKIKLTRYIDKLLKKKYKTYVRLKSDDSD
ncbi:XrtA/PEP-CTERM system-associated ATPase [Aestuariibacter salexigens]|uniref:XrtA/PEP-CTERM system-associated ATPase n=1 Tax=Aestuariibacter salexigens TaxID=226010 RepID=UPI00041D2F97|nr:XrtA/PEP-CTERM system-associated ATPase [Aestuariibacter salexigens]